MKTDKHNRHQRRIAKMVQRRKFSSIMPVDAYLPGPTREWSPQPPVFALQAGIQDAIGCMLVLVAQLVRYDAASIMLLKNGVLYAAGWRGYDQFYPEDIFPSLQQSVDDFPLDGQAVRSQQAVIVEDTRRSPQWVRLKETAWIRSHLVIPICANGLVLGLLRLDSREPGSFLVEDVSRLQPLVDAVAVSLENVRFYEQSRQELEDRILAERELRRSRARHRMLLNAIPDAILCLTSEGMVFDFNATSLVELNATPESLLGQNLRHLMPPDIAKLFMQYLRNALGTGAIQTFEYRQGSGSDAREYEVYLITGDNQEAFALIRNITYRKRVERHAAHAERLAALGRLSAGLAHEINNPLQSIQTHLDLMLDYDLDSQKNEAFLQIIRDEVARLSRISRQMLSVAQPPAPLTRKPVALADSLEHILLLVSNRLEKSEIQLTKEYYNVAPVFAIPDQLQQIFLNLIMNMIDAIELNQETGRLNVVVYPEGDNVSVSFTNSGPIIPPDVLARICDPFFTTKPDGNGLGLWISQDLIKQHHGKLNVENLGEQKGVIFTINFPVLTLQGQKKDDR